MRLFSARPGIFPSNEARFLFGTTFRVVAVPCLREQAGAASHGGFVGGDDFVSRAVLADLAVVDPDDALAEAANLVELMGDEDDGAAGAGDVTHFAEAFLLEVDVTDGENFVNEEDFRLEMSGDGEGQSDVHSAGIMLDGRVDEFVDFGERYDFVELSVDLSLTHA